MQEFSSISVSSYEAGALADQLTEQSKDGWSVVAIVPTGSTVTAYLSRDGSGGAVAAVADTSATSATTATTTTDEATSTDDTDDASDGEEPVTDASSHPVPTTADGSDSSGGDAAVAEAPGWAADGAAAATAAEATTSAAASQPTEVPAVSTPSEAPAAAAGAASAAGGAAPAGWYADPSSRFELRYWDGSQWTEHVSRAGQQYTDPPVA